MIAKVMEIRWSEELKCWNLTWYMNMNASQFHGISTALSVLDLCSSFSSYTQVSQPLINHISFFCPFILRLLSSLLKDGADQSVALEAGILASSGNRLGGYGEDGGLSPSSPPGSAPGSASRSGIYHASLRF